jgi:aerobic carbon-monoxide dehydrogenase medium subunit
MHPFEYLAPASLDEALAILARYRDEAKVLAGGQSLLPILNYRLAKPAYVVDINGLPLEGVQPANGRLRLGALTRHATLAESPDVAHHCPIVREAARLIGNVRVRALGTLGGSLVHADPAAELPMVMLALDARFTLASTRGVRTVPAHSFFTGYLSTVLDADELLIEIDVPLTRGMGSAVEEISRRAGDFAMVAVAALVRVDRRGRVDDARLALAGVGPTPARAPAAEEVLVGHEPTAERVARAAETARATVQPESDVFVSAAYRTMLSGVLVRRALTRAVGHALAAA